MRYHGYSLDDAQRFRLSKNPLEKAEIAASLVDLDEKTETKLANEKNMQKNDGWVFYSKKQFDEYSILTNSQQKKK